MFPAVHFRRCKIDRAHIPGKRLDLRPDNNFDGDVNGNVMEVRIMNENENSALWFAFPVWMAFVYCFIQVVLIPNNEQDTRLWIIRMICSLPFVFAALRWTGNIRPRKDRLYGLIIASMAISAVVLWKFGL